MLCDSMVGSLFQLHEIHAVGASSLAVRAGSIPLSNLPVVGADRIAM